MRSSHHSRSIFVRHKAMITPVSLCVPRLRSRYSNFRLRLQLRASSLYFLAPAPTSRSFWFRLQNKLFQKIRKKHCIVCITRLPNKLSLWMQNPNFRLRFHHPKVFGSGSSLAELFWLRLQQDPAQGPQPYCVY